MNLSTHIGGTICIDIDVANRDVANDVVSMSADASGDAANDVASMTADANGAANDVVAQTAGAEVTAAAEQSS